MAGLQHGAVVLGEVPPVCAKYPQLASAMRQLVDQRNEISGDLRRTDVNYLCSRIRCDDVWHGNLSTYKYTDTTNPAEARGIAAEMIRPHSVLISIVLSVLT